MDYWVDLRRRELVREAQERRLASEVRKAYATRTHSNKRPGAVEVRWSLLEDEAKVAELLELNGMPRWVAFEERFVIAERDGEVLAAIRYRTEPRRLLLGLLVADPWVEERRLAVDLYAGTRRLALELGASDVVARINGRHVDHPHEAGYHRWGGGWRMDLSRPVERREELPAGGWRRRIAHLSASVVLLLLPKKEQRKSRT